MATLKVFNVSYSWKEFAGNEVNYLNTNIIESREINIEAKDWAHAEELANEWLYNTEHRFLIQMFSRSEVLVRAGNNKVIHNTLPHSEWCRVPTVNADVGYSTKGYVDAVGCFDAYITLT